MGALALRPADLQEFGGVPLVQDLRLGEVLGFSSPVDIRKLIRRNRDRLERHGDLIAMAARKSGARGRPINSFYLNERQAYRLCMWSDAPNADAVQEQMVEVFLAWRHGRFMPAEVTNDADRFVERMAEMSRRLEQLEQAMQLEHVRADKTFALALAHAPAKKHHRYPVWWDDMAIRERAIRFHRQMTGPQAIARILEEVGRAPTKSSLARFWLRLDEQIGRGTGRARR
jgi:hypothetical protein